MERPTLAARPFPVPLVRDVALIVAALAALLILPWMGMNSGLTVQPAFAGLDPEGAFVFITVHHLVQGGVAVVAIAMLVAAGWSWREFGLAWGDVRLALRIVGIFAAIYTVVTLGFDFLPYAVSGQQPGLAYHFTPANIVGVLAFEWLLVGVSEEILFRGLIMGLLARAFHGHVRLGMGRAAFRVSVAGILAAAIFAFAHTVAYDRAFFLPFTFRPDWLQVVEAFLLGLYYAALREKTGSLLGAIISHNVSDGLYMSMTFLAVAVTR